MDLFGMTPNWEASACPTMSLYIETARSLSISSLFVYSVSALP